MDLKTNLSTLGLTYKFNAKKLEKLGIKTVEDLLLYVPSRYENLSVISKVNLLQAGEKATVKGYVLEVKNTYTKNRKKIQQIIIQDKSGRTLLCIWFNQVFILRIIKPGDFLSVAGKIIFFQNKITMIVEEYEVLSDENAETVHTGRLVPVYPETRGLSSKWIRNRVKELITNKAKDSLHEYLPENIIIKNELLDFKTSIEQSHFPKNEEMAKKGLARLAFDELFLIQLSAAYRKREWQTKKTSHILKISPFKDELEKLLASLPFTLTGAQKNALKDISADFTSASPMNRLLEGDVGSGKTVVAAIAMYIAYLNGFTSVFMAPTEILAKQHFDTINNLLSPFGIKVCLITGGSKIGISNQKAGGKKSKKNHNSKFIISDSNTDLDIFVGTHALLNKNLEFENLGFVVIDEQQRFGVKQRSVLRDKGLNPHFLTMTATPIPRTVFLTLYGDLDFSYLDEMPRGRQTIKTWLVPSVKREPAYKWIKDKIMEQDEKGSKNQVFIICPFIEESESMITVKAAVKEYERLKNSVFKDFNIGLLHGKLKSKEKDKIIQDFREGKIDILVATPVVEVGIDIKNATIMLIEAAERFGLAQLHQLRGRVGRGNKQSFCLLFTDAKSEKVQERLKYLETNHLGAELAEIDLKLRGPGELFGTLQHGNTELKIASFSDFELIKKTKNEAEKILPEISLYPALIKKIKTFREENISSD
ncbi:MAG: ATP-dependent DNA helicase RecG [Candidatus Levybacteria bacterium RIFCSPHIGHO2_01_FULL_36_15]|nr:MAG: ATP-dependent DNA helicase RecG [Candidatus Levybacteria bacterium RIFCSPHIGHO2_01_FULL_36_15]OGH39012.1 MAG: ATP-dependent DNA helicase RecG [Candidatus Levybacteria bacterium RIFCSPLOWO2_01_FULL_36_10]